MPIGAQIYDQYSTCFSPIALPQFSTDTGIQLCHEIEVVANDYRFGVVHGRCSAERITRIMNITSFVCDVLDHKRAIGSSITHPQFFTVGSIISTEVEFISNRCKPADLSLIVIRIDVLDQNRAIGSSITLVQSKHAVCHIFFASEIKRIAYGYHVPYLCAEDENRAIGSSITLVQSKSINAIIPTEIYGVTNSGDIVCTSAICISSWPEVFDHDCAGFCSIALPQFSSVDSIICLEVECVSNRREVFHVRAFWCATLVST